jgi:hypothetical protein
MARVPQPSIQRLRVLSFVQRCAGPTSPSPTNPPTTPSSPRHFTLSREVRPPRIPRPGLLPTSLGDRTFRSDIRPAKRSNYLSSPHPFAPSACVRRFLPSVCRLPTADPSSPCPLCSNLRALCVKTSSARFQLPSTHTVTTANRGKEAAYTPASSVSSLYPFTSACAPITKSASMRRASPSFCLLRRAT